jgi:FkbM family methyltransferase
MTRQVGRETAYDTLMRPVSPWVKNAAERAEMTVACDDAEGIPRVPNAGASMSVDGVEVQIMHNGLLVKKNGYQGEWQATTIEALRGVHEPQEEKVFYEVLKRSTPGSTILELGSWWSYYSMWFVKSVKNGKAICCEPDPVNMELGKSNARLNSLKVGKDMFFYHCAAGSKNDKTVTFENEDKTKNRVKIRTVDSIVKERGLEKLEILHLDIQGAEFDALQGAIQTISQNKLRFIFISTHHYSISGNPLMHQKCLEFIKSRGGNIISEHTVLESCSGDGLIVASFDEQDADFKVEVSLQHSNDSLFRAYEYDIDILWREHDRLVNLVNELGVSLSDTSDKLTATTRRAEELQQFIEEITPLKKHLKRQVGIRVKKLQKHKTT